MTPEQIALVEHTLDEVLPRLEAVAEDFYVRLFAADPEIRALFLGDPVTQRARFAAELRVVCRTIRRHPAFVTAARDLGARHATYGVRAGHYRTVGLSLLAALGSALGTSWTPAVEEAWRLAYHLTAETMMAGAADHRPG
jgi:hemoglobin-like flavoprotein